MEKKEIPYLQDMKKDFKSIKFEKKILKDLYESVNGIFAFTFYSKYKVEPEDMFIFINKNIENGILTYDENRLNLTEDGRNIYLKQMFQNRTNNSKFSNIPIEFIREKIEIDKPYLPNRSKVSLEILNLKGGKETST